MQDGIYAKFNTTKGEILIKLAYNKVPGTVGNFVGLAEGNIENKPKPQGKPYYDGLTFHRVLADFMVQGGCPSGDGYGGPGYMFDDEFHPRSEEHTSELQSRENSVCRLLIYQEFSSCFRL